MDALEDLSHRVRSVVISALDLNDREAALINEETSAADVEKWTSLAHIGLILELERCFNIEFPDEEIVDLASVGSIIQTLDRRNNNVSSLD